MKRPSAPAIGAALLLTVLACLVYRPDRPLPFDLWDFREFLPILRDHPGVSDGYQALLRYYAGHGRMNPLFYLTFAVQFAVFGDWAWGWQLLRFAVMLADTLLLLWLARRLGLGWLAATTSAALFVVATPAVRGWVQLMAEPQVMLFLLVGSHLALDLDRAPRWRGRVAMILACLLAAFLSKEIAGMLGAFVVVLAIVGPGQPLDPGRLRTPRHRALAIGALLVVVAVGVMILRIRSLPVATGYGMAYGKGTLSAARLAENVAAIVLPVHPNGQTALGLLYPANILAILALALGAVAWRQVGTTVASLLRVAALGLAVILCGALAYWPWPKFDSFYALPFFAAPALLIGAGVEGLWRRGGIRRGLAAAAATLIIGYAAIPAARSTATAAAALQLNVSVARLLGTFGPDDTVYVAGPDHGPRRLPIGAAELRNYAVAIEATVPARAPVVLDRDCAEVPASTERTVLITYSYGCGLMPTPTVRFLAGYRWRDWLTFAARSDTLAVDAVGPPVARWRGARP